MAARKVTTKKITEPKSAVKVVPPVSNDRRAIANFWESNRVQNAKSGADAKTSAMERRVSNILAKAPGSPTPTVKINSANPTRQGSGISGTSGRNVAKIYRPMGGSGGAGGGNWRNMFK